MERYTNMEDMTIRAARTSSLPPTTRSLAFDEMLAAANSQKARAPSQPLFNRGEASVDTASVAKDQRINGAAATAYPYGIDVMELTTQLCDCKEEINTLKQQITVLQQKLAACAGDSDLAAQVKHLTNELAAARAAIASSTSSLGAGASRSFMKRDEFLKGLEDLHAQISQFVDGSVLDDPLLRHPGSTLLSTSLLASTLNWFLGLAIERGANMVRNYEEQVATALCSPSSPERSTEMSAMRADITSRFAFRSIVTVACEMYFDELFDFRYEARELYANLHGFMLSLDSGSAENAQWQQNGKIGTILIKIATNAARLSAWCVITEEPIALCVPHPDLQQTGTDFVTPSANAQPVVIRYDRKTQEIVETGLPLANESISGARAVLPVGIVCQPRKAMSSVWVGIPKGADAEQLSHCGPGLPPTVRLVVVLPKYTYTHADLNTQLSLISVPGVTPHKAVGADLEKRTAISSRETTTLPDYSASAPINEINSKGWTATTHETATTPSSRPSPAPSPIRLGGHAPAPAANWSTANPMHLLQGVTGSSAVLPQKERVRVYAYMDFTTSVLPPDYNDTSKAITLPGQLIDEASKSPAAKVREPSSPPTLKTPIKPSETVVLKGMPAVGYSTLPVRGFDKHPESSDRPFTPPAGISLVSMPQRHEVSRSQHQFLSTMPRSQLAAEAALDAISAERGLGRSTSSASAATGGIQQSNIPGAQPPARKDLRYSPPEDYACSTTSKLRSPGSSNGAGAPMGPTRTQYGPPLEPPRVNHSAPTGRKITPSTTGASPPLMTSPGLHDRVSTRMTSSSVGLAGYSQKRAEHPTPLEGGRTAVLSRVSDDASRARIGTVTPQAPRTAQAKDSPYSPQPARRTPASSTPSTRKPSLAGKPDKKPVVQPWRR